MANEAAVTKPSVTEFGDQAASSRLQTTEFGDAASVATKPQTTEFGDSASPVRVAAKTTEFGDTATAPIPSLGDSLSLRNFAKGIDPFIDRFEKQMKGSKDTLPSMDEFRQFLAHGQLPVSPAAHENLLPTPEEMANPAHESDADVLKEYRLAALKDTISKAGEPYMHLPEMPELPEGVTIPSAPGAELPVRFGTALYNRFAKPLIEFPTSPLGAATFLVGGVGGEVAKLAIGGIFFEQTAEHAYKEVPDLAKVALGIKHDNPPGEFVQPSFERPTPSIPIPQVTAQERINAFVQAGGDLALPTMIGLGLQAHLGEGVVNGSVNKAAYAEALERMQNVRREMEAKGGVPATPPLPGVAQGPKLSDAVDVGQSFISGGNKFTVKKKDLASGDVTLAMDIPGQHPWVFTVPFNTKFTPDAPAPHFPSSDETTEAAPRPGSPPAVASVSQTVADAPKVVTSTQGLQAELDKQRDAAKAAKSPMPTPEGMDIAKAAGQVLPDTKETELHSGMLEPKSVAQVRMDTFKESTYKIQLTEMSDEKLNQQLEDWKNSPDDDRQQHALELVNEELKRRAERVDEAATNTGAMSGRAEVKAAHDQFTRENAATTPSIPTPVENAIQKPSPSPVDVQPEAGNGQGVGVKNALDQKPSGARQPGQPPQPAAPEAKGLTGASKPEVKAGQTKAEAAADDFFKRRKAGGMPKSQAGFITTPDPALAAAWVIDGARRIKQGVAEKAEWLKDMADRYGDDIKPHLGDLWTRSMAFRDEQQRDPTDIRVIHFGPAGLDTIDPAKMGQAGRANRYDKMGLDKAFFFRQGSTYGQDEGLVNADGHVYGTTVKSSDIYDTKTDPLGVWRNTVNREEREQIIKDAGYKGYSTTRADGADIVAMLQPTKVRELASDKSAQVVPPTPAEHPSQWKFGKYWLSPDGQFHPLEAQSDTAGPLAVHSFWANRALGGADDASHMFSGEHALYKEGWARVTPMGYDSVYANKGLGRPLTTAQQRAMEDFGAKVGADAVYYDNGNSHSMVWQKGQVPTAVSQGAEAAGRETRRIAGGEKEGQYVGAPEGINTPAKLDGLRTLLTQAALRGEPGRYWYEDSSKAILKLTGGDIREADKIAQLVGITSPQTPVSANWDNAVRLYLRWKSGVSRDEFMNMPLPQAAVENIGESAYKQSSRDAQGRVLDTVGRYPADMMARAADLLYDNKDWTGRKTNNFYNNLMTEIDPSKVQGVTADMWIARFFGYPDDGVSPGRDYDFMQREITRTASQLDWAPHQAQAAIWVYSKSLWESMDADVRKAADRKGIKDQSLGAKDGKFDSLYREMFNSRLRKDLKMSQGGVQPAAEATFNFGTAMQGKPIFLSLESVPGRNTGLMGGLFDADYPTRLAFTNDLMAARTDPTTGEDLMGRILGWNPVNGDLETLPSSYYNSEGVLESNPTARPQFFGPAVKGGEHTLRTDPFAMDRAKTYAAVVGHLTHQESVAGYRPFYVGSADQMNASKIDLGRPLATDEVGALQKNLAMRLTLEGHQPGDIAYYPDHEGGALINVSEKNSLTTKDFHSIVKDVTENSIPDHATLGKFHAETFYIPASEYGDYLGALTPDVRQRLDTEVTPRLDSVYQKWADQGYGSTPQDLARGASHDAHPDLAAESAVDGARELDPRSSAERWADGVLTNREKKAAGGLYANPIDPEWFAAALTKAACVVARGIVNKAQWAKEMIDTIGDEVKPHLDTLYKTALDIIPRDRDATSIKNAQIDLERVARGLPPVMEAAHKEMGEGWQAAKAILSDRPEAAIDLVQALQENPRPANDVENSLLLHRQIELQNEFGKIISDLKNPDNPIERIGELEGRLALASDKLVDLYDVLKRTGTENSRGLNTRKLLAKEDYTLASMVTRKRVANDNLPLTGEQQKQVEKLHQLITDAQNKQDARDVKVDNDRASHAMDQTMGEFGKGAKGPAELPNPRAASIAQRVTDYLDKQADAAYVRLQSKLSALHANVDPTIISDLAIIGAKHLAHGLVDSAEWGRAFMKDITERFGDVAERFRANLDEIWKASNDEADRAVKAGAEGRDVEAVKKAVRKTDLAGKQQRILDGLRKAVSDEDAEKADWGRYVKSLAKNLFLQGLRDRDALIDTVHNILRKEVDPDLTRREAMDAISGYGDYRRPNQAELEVKYRDTVAQMRKIAALEDIRNRVAAKRSGFQRDVPSAEVRRLDQQIAEAKRKFGVVSSDPESQLRTALQTIKTRLRNSIADAEYQRATGERTIKTKTPPPSDAEVESLREQLRNVRELLDREVPRPGITDAERTQRMLKGVQRDIQLYEDRIKAGSGEPIHRGVPTPITPELKASMERRDALKAEYQMLQDALNPNRKAELANQIYRARAQGIVARYQERLANKDFDTKPREPLKLDPESQKWAAKVQQAKQEFQRGLIEDRLSKRSLDQKVMDTAVRWRRGFVLSGWTTLGKLTSAAIWRGAVTVGEEAVGGVEGLLLPKIFDMAPRQGGFSVKAEAQAVADGIVKGAQDAWETGTTGHSELDRLYGRGREGAIGESDVRPFSLADTPGYIHGALKAPIKRAEFARSVQKRVEWGMRHGVDVEDKAVQTQICVEAYKDAQRAIFLQDNIVTDAYNWGLRRLEKANPETGQPSTAGKAIATGLRMAMPIVRVPTNIVAETMEYAVGSVTGSWKVARAYRNGIENLKPEEADLIARQLKKGSLGAAALLVGYLNPNVFGGLYQPGTRRSPGDVRQGSIRINGVDIPVVALHHPLQLTAQLGATVRRVQDYYVQRGQNWLGSLSLGSAAGMWGLAEETPFIREQIQTAKAYDSRQKAAFFGEVAKSLTIPMLVQWYAQHQDKDARGEPIQRKPSTRAPISQQFLQAYETGLPWARENVPAHAQRP